FGKLLIGGQISLNVKHYQGKSKGTFDRQVLISTIQSTQDECERQSEDEGTTPARAQGREE
ncbi:MAG: hypothetical protein ABSF74_08660, partial [Dehalococcoidia bacterium]